jgi:LAO/AO transport system kinase
MGTLKANPEVAAELPRIEASVRAGTLLATIAVERIMQMMRL